MDTDKLGESFSTLSDLLKAKSSHFAATIDKQVSSAVWCMRYGTTIPNFDAVGV